MEHTTTIGIVGHQQLGFYTGYPNPSRDWGQPAADDDDEDDDDDEHDEDEIGLAKQPVVSVSPLWPARVRRQFLFCLWIPMWVAQQGTP